MKFRVYCQDQDDVLLIPISQWPLVEAVCARGAAMYTIQTSDHASKAKANPSSLVHVYDPNTRVMRTIEVERAFTVTYRAKEVL